MNKNEIQVLLKFIENNYRVDNFQEDGSTKTVGLWKANAPKRFAFNFIDLIKEMAERALEISEEKTHVLQWQPIETAPKDGTQVLLKENSEILVGFWDIVDFCERRRENIEWWNYGVAYVDASNFMPTLWAKLPEIKEML